MNLPCIHRPVCSSKSIVCNAFAFTLCLLWIGLGGSIAEAETVNRSNGASSSDRAAALETLKAALQDLAQRIDALESEPQSDAQAAYISLDSDDASVPSKQRARQTDPARQLANGDKALSEGNERDAERFYLAVLSEDPESDLAWKARGRLLSLYRRTNRERSGFDPDGAADERAVEAEVAVSRPAKRAPIKRIPDIRLASPPATPDDAQPPENGERVSTNADRSNATDNAGAIRPASPRIVPESLATARKLFALGDPSSFRTAVGDRIFFEADSAEISPSARDVLVSQAEWLTANGHGSIVIEAHADDPGSDQHNKALAERRGEGVRRALVFGGVDARRIELVIFGRSKPAAPCKLETCARQNRRVVTVVKPMAESDTAGNSATGAQFDAAPRADRPRLPGWDDAVAHPLPTRATPARLARAHERRRNAHPNDIGAALQELTVFANR